MSVIIFDGPEKAGKTTTIKALKVTLDKLFVGNVEVVKWGPVKPDDRVYSDLLQAGTETHDTIYIWDRTWASEYVYGKLLNRTDHRMHNDPWLGAWLHDRAVQANGLRIMMLGPSANTLKKLRDGSDLLVKPADEIALYREYAERFGWMILEGYEHNEKDLKRNIKKILKSFPSFKSTHVLPPHWAGPQDADVVFVGNERSERPIKGGWLPFTSRMTTEFGRIFGDRAITYAWTNAHDCPPSYLKRRKVIIACGSTAQVWVNMYVKEKENSDQTIISIPHPSYLFRFKNEKTEKSLRHTVSDLDEVLHFQGE